MELYYQFVITCCLLNFMVLIAGQQGVPPGVPPQHYQQPHQPQMQQVPVPQHQMHVQQQVPHQVPMQQVPMQQQVPQQQMHVQQVPQQQMHMQQPMQQHGAHHAHHGQPQVLNVANIAQEKQHIAEHMSVPMDTSKMSEQELQFHYFKMHDSDNNNKLDGCELIKSLIHWHEQGHGEPGKAQLQEKLFKDDELVALIDPILAMDDSNNDGYIDYPEFVRAQQKNAAGHPPPAPQQRK